MESEKILIPFSPTAWTSECSVRFSARSAAEGFHLRYRLKTDSPDLLAKLLPETAPALASAPPRRRDELWQTTCFEAFFGVADSTAYFELNLAPSGDWAWYAFSDYRKEMRKPELAFGNEPRIVGVTRDDTTISLEAFVPVGCFGGATVESLWPTAVLDRRAELSYWAAVHRGPQPDFHLRR